MEIITVQARDTHAKAKQLRAAGFVPCVIYGGALQASLPIQMSKGAAIKLLRQSRQGTKVQLELSGNAHLVQIKDKERDAISNEIVHIGFQALAQDQKVNSVAHILLQNADKVPCTLEKKLLEVPFASLPQDMIDTVTLDLAGLPIGTVLTLADIPEFVSGKIELQVPSDSMVLKIRDKKRTGAPRAEE